MKKILGSLFIIILLSSPTLAQGVYIGAGGGFDSVSHDQDDGTNASTNKNDDADIIKVFAGYNFNDILGVEVSYNDLGNSSTFYAPDFNAQQNDVKSYVVAAVARKNLGPVEVFGKAGISFLEYDYKATDPTTAASNGTAGPNSDELYYGIGLQKEIWNGFGLRAEYEYFGEVGSKTQNTQLDIDALSISVYKNF